MKLFKYLIIISFLLSPFLNLIAQYDSPDQDYELEGKKKGKYEDSKFFFGGNFGLSLGSQNAYIEASPFIGYKFTPRLWLGAGIPYIFIKQGESYKSSIYGLESFIEFAILDNINETTNLGLKSVFLRFEDEFLSFKPGGIVNGQYVALDRGWYNIAMAGAGLRFPIGSRQGLSLMIMWGLNENFEYLYSNPEIRLNVYF